MVILSIEAKHCILDVPPCKVKSKDYLIFNTGYM